MYKNPDLPVVGTISDKMCPNPNPDEMQFHALKEPDPPDIGTIYFKICPNLLLSPYYWFLL